jgi:aldehyde dehydrogenase (NAD+)
MDSALPPFARMNALGVGSAHGQAGLRAPRNDRAVQRNRVLPLPMLFPTCGRRTTRGIHLANRVLG